MRETKKVGFQVEMQDSKYAGGFMSARTSRRPQLSDIQERRNDFRNMSPKSL